jgi:anti-sigma factor RsiW
MSVLSFRSRRDCSDIASQLELYALDGLEATETGRVERHLGHCAACRRALSDALELVSFLPRALDPVEPPPELLEGILGRVREGRRARLRRRAGVGVAAAAVLALAVLQIRPLGAAILAGPLGSPDVAVINLFAAIDSPLSARYEYRTATEISFEKSVGRLLVNATSGEWRLVVHGLPRPPRGSRYVLTAQADGEEFDLGQIERWQWGVATLSGESDVDLLGTERLSLVLVSRSSRLHLLDAVDGAW